MKNECQFSERERERPPLVCWLEQRSQMFCKTVETQTDSNRPGDFTHHKSYPANEGGKWPELSLQNILFFYDLLRLRGTFVFCIKEHWSISRYNTAKLSKNTTFTSSYVQYSGTAVTPNPLRPHGWSILNLFAKKKSAEFEIRFIV